MDVVKTEALLRLCVVLLLGLSCCLVGLDSQTKLLFASVRKKATFTYLNSYVVLVYIESAAAAYNLVQVMIRYCLLSNGFNVPHKNMAWIFFLLDQAAAYSVFAVNFGALEASVVALRGVKIFEWMKWCDKYTRFCTQLGGALACALFASLLLILLSSISAFQLFRLYSPKQFLILKKL